MGFTATAGSQSAFRRVPPGVWVARCIHAIDLGTQKVEFQGDVKLQHKILLSWEVFGEDEYGVPLTVDVDGKEMPLTISSRYTLSLNAKAKLRADLEAWRGKKFTEEELKSFDVSKLLGAFCMLNVVESKSADGTKTYANISSITPMPRGMPKPEGKHPLVVFDLDAPDMKAFDDFYPKLQDTIKASVEWQARKPAPAPAQAAASAAESFADMTDDVPFISASASFDMESRLSRRMRRYA